MTQFPHVIDNTMRKVLVKCQQAAAYKYEHGLNDPNEKRVDLIAGGAFAKGIEVARRKYFGEHTLPNVAAQAGIHALYEKYGGYQTPANSNKTADRMAGALQYYLDKFPLQDEKLVPILLPNGQLAVEMYFEYPMGVYHPDTNIELLYAGNWDLLALDIRDGGVWVVDEKTTSQMGEKWVNQWPLDSQMTGYVWLAQKWLAENNLDYEVKGAIIGGVAVRKYDYEAARFKTYREDWEVDRWFKQLQNDITGWKIAYLQGNHNMALDHACAYYNNPCEFVPLCKSKEPEKLTSGYKVEFWNPKDRK